MKSQLVRHAIVAGMALAGVCQASAAFAQAEVGGASGGAIFENYCAACHGRSARGDGPLADSLKVRPADLTMIAKRSGGEFPSDQVARIIDGKNPVKGHGGGDMPIWGDAFAKSTDTMPVAEKIRRLVAHLQSIQVKP